MTSGPLVSIVTPCLNGEPHIGRFLESILGQTETDLELIVVNDGSTDGTQEVVASYQRDIHRTLRGFHYIVQENRGLGGAINAGLRYVSGEFLVWPDCDDYLEPESIARRVAALRRLPDVAVVTSDAYIRNVDHLDAISGFVSSGSRHNADPHQFEHLLRADSIFASGTHMARTSAFDLAHRGRQIYPARRGQNWQMLLPLYYKYPRHYLDEPLYNYVVSPSSMSKGDSSTEQIVRRAREHLGIIAATLSTMDMPASDRRRAASIASVAISRRLLRHARGSGDAVLAAECLQSLRRGRSATASDHLLWAAASYPGLLDPLLALVPQRLLRTLRVHSGAPGRRHR